MGGHWLGLMNPDVELFDEDEEGNLTPYKPNPTATQRYLWRMYTQDLNNVIAMADGDRIILVVMGDQTHGNRYPSHLVSASMANQILIAIANLKPWFEHKNVECVRFAPGTDSHEFNHGSASTLICNQVSAMYPGRDIGIVRHGLPDIAGVKVDFAHHGPSPGIRVWTAGNVMRYYLRSLMINEVLAGRIPPRLVFRGHYHEYRRETVRIQTGEANQEWVSDIFIVPAYCGLTTFGQKVTRSEYEIDCGLVAVEIENGELAGVHPFWSARDLRTEERL